LLDEYGKLSFHLHAKSLVGEVYHEARERSKKGTVVADLQIGATSYAPRRVFCRRLPGSGRSAPSRRLAV
jgi:hypothetical protein